LEQKNWSNIMSELTSWEDMTPLEQAQCTYWDMYKDAYGHRPRGIDTSSWTLAAFDEEFERLGKTIEADYQQRKLAEAASVARFEEQVKSFITMGANDREAAIRWFHEAEQTNGDHEYLCYCLGLPYGYFRKLEAA
jgi:hypothetical protein